MPCRNVGLWSGDVTPEPEDCEEWQCLQRLSLQETMSPRWDHSGTLAESIVSPAQNRGQWLAHMCQEGVGFG